MTKGVYLGNPNDPLGQRPGGREVVEFGRNRSGKTVQLMRAVSSAIADARPPEYARVLGDMAVDKRPIYITPEFYEMIKDMDVYADALASGHLVVMKELPKL